MTAPDDHVRAAAERIVAVYEKPLPRPSIAELEKILNEPDGPAIEIRPDGSIGPGTSDALIVARAYLALPRPDSDPALTIVNRAKAALLSGARDVDTWDALWRDITAAIQAGKPRPDADVTETARAVAILQDLVEWSVKANDEHEGDDYLNGESDKYPGDGQQDLRRIVKRAKAAVNNALAADFAPAAALQAERSRAKPSEDVRDTGTSIATGWHDGIKQELNQADVDDLAEWIASALQEHGDARAAAATEAERERCAKIADAAEDNRSDADSPYDNGSGSCGYAKACYATADAIRGQRP